MKPENKKLISIMLISATFMTIAIFMYGCSKNDNETSAENTTMPMDHEMANMEGTMSSAEELAAAGIEQTICPVMGEPIDKNVFVEYEGKKVYFCCTDCEAAFLENPEEYISKLPQFSE